MSSRTHTTQAPKTDSPTDHLERRPMLNISNKLHAIVDESVPKLSS